MLPIKIIPEKILRQKAKRIKVADIKNKDFRQLILDIGETMIKADGVGLAAPQVGKSIRLIAVNTKDGVITLINPRILLKSLKKEIGSEGCLSVPAVFGLVKRSNKIKVTACNHKGKRIFLSANGLLARVIQHEIDHLDGILFIDRAQKIVEGQEKLKEYLRSNAKSKVEPS